MKKDELRITIYRYSNPDELPGNRKKLIDKAKQATKNAWAPYSQFRVGAALELTNGKIITGTNQENIAFPSGLCAERVALFYAGSQYPGVAITRIAIAAYANGQFVSRPVFPCGDCRQVLLEHENRVKLPVEIIMFGESEIIMVKSAADLLPLPFDYDLTS